MKSAVYHESLHLDMNQLLPPDEKCPFCFSKDRKRTVLLQKDPDVYLLICKNCYAASASRIPTEEALDQFYSNYYVGEMTNKITFYLPERLAVHIYKNSKSFIDRKKISILDFGGGDGAIAVELAKKLIANKCEHVKITLVDYNSQIKNINDSRINIKHHSKLNEINNQQYDIIIASAIIEHLPQPINELTSLLKLIRKGGVFYARTPYIFPILTLFNTFRLNLDFTYPGHLHDLGPLFWNNIINNLKLSEGYQIIRSAPSMVETSFKENFFRTLCAYILKAPWFVFRNKYKIVGGWEVFIRRTT
ncbi:MAG: methyltransferase domain-containing protein [Syntrophomonas sp.]